ncbi:tetratricopeptide repeat protein [Phycisphaeraceae bacterium D3-23]
MAKSGMTQYTTKCLSDLAANYAADPTSVTSALTLLLTGGGVLAAGTVAAPGLFLLAGFLGLHGAAHLCHKREKSESEAAIRAFLDKLFASLESDIADIDALLTEVFIGQGIEAEDLRQRLLFIGEVVKNTDAASEDTHARVQRIEQLLETQTQQAAHFTQVIQASPKLHADYARQLDFLDFAVELLYLQGEQASDEREAIDERQEARLLSMEARLRATFESTTKTPGTDPTQVVYPPEVLEAAQELSERGDKEQQALADIIKKRHKEANAIVDDLLANPLAETFRLLTLKGDNWYAAGAYDQAIAPYETALSLRPESVSAGNNVIIAHAQARLGDISAHQHRAIAVAESILSRVPAKSTDWATTQNNLGMAWADMPIGDRAENLGRAIQAFEQALEVYTRDAHPVAWAATQNNLGIAWANMPTGDGAENLGRAIQAYEQALEVRTRAAHPAAWATTQNNLGITWGKMPTGDRAENLGRAIQAFEQALEVYTRAAHPADWATTQNNLGIAWADMPTGDRAENLGRAIQAYEQALEVRTRDAHPADWATTQNNLGTAWGKMPTGDRAENLGRAIQAFEQALEVRTRDAHPADWATTQNNLGIAWANMPTGDRAENLGRAIQAFEQALEVYTRAAHPADWAATQNNLGNAWRNMPTGDRAENLGRAIQAYEQALEVRTRDAHPAAWAATQNNLGIVWADLAEVAGEDRCDRLRQAIACSKAALQVRTAAAFPRGHAATQKNMAIDRNAYESMGCAAGDTGVAFEDIPPAT